MSAQGIHHVTLIVDDREQASRFYGDVLGMEEKSRPGFRFPGMFYHCGSQEVHLIIAARPLTRDDLYIQVENGGDITRRYIHRHAAFQVPDIEEMKAVWWKTASKCCLIRLSSSRSAITTSSATW